MLKSIIQAAEADMMLRQLLDEAREYASVYALARQRQKGCDGMGELAMVQEEFRDAVDKMMQYCKTKNYISDATSYELESVAVEIGSYKK